MSIFVTEFTEETPRSRSKTNSLMKWTSVPLFVIGATLGVCAEWREVLSENFESTDALKNWLLDGSADVKVGGHELQVTTKEVTIDGVVSSGSVLWCKRPFWGDLKISFKCRAEAGTRAILFFNARANSPQRDIFAWQRPHSTYGDYSYERRLELYSMGILRSDQPTLNLRHLGGDVPEKWIRMMPYPPDQYPQRYLSNSELARALAAAGIESLPADGKEVRRVAGQGKFREFLAPHRKQWSEVNQGFQTASVMIDHEAARPVFADANKTYDVSVIVVGHRIVVNVDGATLLDYEDKPRAQKPLAGGYFGFRNFRPTTTWYSHVRVFQRMEE